MTVASVIGPQTVNSEPTCSWTSLMQVNCKAHIKLQLKRKNHERSGMPPRALELIVRVSSMLPGEGADLVAEPHEEPFPAPGLGRRITVKAFGVGNTLRARVHHLAHQGGDFLGAIEFGEK